MPTFFIILTLESGFEWRDFLLNDLTLDYATEVLEIPEEYIESVEYASAPDRLEIVLSENLQMAGEDWYYALIPFAA